MGSELIRYNVINKFVGDKKITWEYQADENGQWLEADGALTRIAALQSQLNEAKAGWDSAISDLYAAAEIAKGMQSQLDAKWISVDVKLPPVMRAVLTTDGKRVTQTYRTSHDKRMWGAWAPDQVTFWQPLPPPPSGAKEQK